MIDPKDYMPLLDETMEQYKYRLFSFKKKIKGITWEDVKNCILHHYNVDQSVDFIRHEYYGLRKSIEIDNANVGTRILSISDTHVPFNLSVDTFAKYRNKVDILVLNGDITDCYSISAFSKNMRLSVIEELIKGREFIIDLIEYINPKKVKINYGNHDLRFGHYLAKKLDTDILELMPDTALELICVTGFRHYDKRLRTKVWFDPLVEVFKDSGIEVEYTYSWWCKVGKTIFAHPSAFSSGVSATSVKAMQYFLQEGHQFDSVVLGHTHQVSYTYYGKMHLFEQGCCCSAEDMTYTDGKLYKSQTNGYAYIVQDKIGNLLYDKTKLELI